MEKILMEGKLPILSYFIGILLYVIGLITGNSIILFISFILSGYTMIYEGIEETITDSKQSKRFTPNIHILMGVGAIGAIVIREYGEAALLMIIFTGANLLEHYAESKSQKEITSLLKLNPTEARLIKADGSIEIVAVDDLVIGDHIRVLNGDQVATDGIVIEGYSSIDQSAITGESIPVEVEKDSIVFGGTINGDGVFTFEVTKDSSETVFAKIIEMVSQTQTNISKTATLIKKIEPIYVTVALLFAPIFYLLGLFVFQWGPNDSFYRTMVYLIGVSPCALAATDIPATLSAISNLARHGILFKGGSFLSNFSDIRAIAFDKTGTLTAGKPSVTDVMFIGEHSANLNLYTDILYSMELGSNHPLANAIVNHFSNANKIDVETKNLVGTGLVGYYNNKQYRIAKPTSFDNIDESVLSIKNELEQAGKTVIFFSEDDTIEGIIGIQDVPKESAKQALNYLANENITTVMITGDAKLTGEAIGTQLGIKRVMADVLPEDKANIINELKSEYGVVSMVGDGVNDAPALVASDIGIAMGSGTDIAIESADAVLMKNDLQNIQYTHKVASKLRKIVIQNIIFSMSVVLFLILTNMFTNVALSSAVIIHEGSTILVILNGLRMLKNIDSN